MSTYGNKRSKMKFNKKGKMLNEVKDHLNTLGQKEAKNENQDQNKYLKR